MSEQLASLFWKSLKIEKPGDPNKSYLELGGNSIGIFLLTEGIKTELGKTIDPSILLSDLSSLNGLTEQLKEF